MCSRLGDRRWEWVISCDLKAGMDQSKNSCELMTPWRATHRKLFENGEKLRALGGVREVENMVLAAKQGGDLRPSPVLDAINHAGLRCTLQVGTHPRCTHPARIRTLDSLQSCPLYSPPQDVFRNLPRRR